MRKPSDTERTGRLPDVPRFVSLILPSHLGPGDLCIVQASIDLPADITAELIAPLSIAERERAARFVRREDALRHSLGRGILRHAMASLLGAPAASFDFQLGEGTGKPGLPGGPAFNLSHSGDVVLIALASDGRLGIDVEAIRPLSEVDSLARTSLAPDEFAALQHFPPGDSRNRAFFRGWTRKEALLKALGDGIVALGRISVDLTDGDANTVRRLDSPGENPEDWTVRSLPILEGHEAAFAWDRPVRSIRRIEVRGPVADGIPSGGSPTLDPGV